MCDRKWRTQYVQALKLKGYSIENIMHLGTYLIYFVVIINANIVTAQILASIERERAVTGILTISAAAIYKFMNRSFIESC